jgi:hypothetical protein
VLVVSTHAHTCVAAYGISAALVYGACSGVLLLCQLCVCAFNHSGSLWLCAAGLLVLQCAAMARWVVTCGMPGISYALHGWLLECDCVWHCAALATLGSSTCACDMALWLLLRVVLAERQGPVPVGAAALHTAYVGAIARAECCHLE